MKAPKYILNYKNNWGFLSINTNAIHLLEQNPDKIRWDWLSQNPNAIKLLEQSLAIYNDHLDNDHIIVAWATLRLSNVYRDLGNYKQSKTLMEKSLKIYERYYGKNHIQTIQILRDLERILSK